ncbi:MAG: hypothetical protein QM487_01785 [Candidatus Marithrix sp.]
MSYILLFYLTTSVLTESKSSPETAKKQVIEILSQPDFKTTRKEYHLRYINDSTGILEKPILGFIKIIAQLTEILLWLTLFVLVIIIYNLRIIKKPNFFKSTNYKNTTTVLAKDKISKPVYSDVSQQAWKLWQAGADHAAISLLYCGALAMLHKYYSLQITDNLTENECIKLVRLKQSKQLAKYFINLTRTWQNIAYARRSPNDNEVKNLCIEWQRHFKLD